MHTSLKFAFAASGLVIATAGMTAIAAPQAGDGGAHPRLEAVDTNGDGNVSEAELDAHRANKFAQADADGDGAVSFDEMEAFREAERERRRADRASRHFDRMDADGDGLIGPDEFDARAEKMFDKVDVDGDGVITAEERQSVRERMREARGRRGPGRWTRD